MKKLLLVALVAVGLTACVQDQSVSVPQSDTIAFGNAYLDSAVRAAADPSTTTNTISDFKVWGFMDSNAGTVFTAEEVKKVNGSWGYANTQYWAPLHTYYFSALSPVAGNWSVSDDDAAVEGISNVSFINAEGAIDLLYAATTAETPNFSTLTTTGMQPVTMPFNHILSKVKFTFKNGFTTTNMDVVVSDITMTAPKSGTINLVGAFDSYKTGWVLGSEATTLAFGGVERLDMGAAEECATERFTIPATADYTYNVTFHVTVYAGEEIALEVDKTATIAGYALEMGKAYNFTAEINPDNLGLAPIEFSATVEDWDTTPADVPVGYYIGANGEYVVASAVGLATIAEGINSGEIDSKVNISLSSDIDLSELQGRATGAYEWTPIGSNGKIYEGTFNGNDHTISNFQVTAFEGHAGLFGNARAKIKNLTVENVKIVANHYAGGIVGQGYVNFDNCHVKNINISLTTKDGDLGDKAGGIIGQNCEGAKYIKNCTAENVTIKGYRDLGGIAGMAHSGNIVTDCSVKDITILQDLSVNYQETTPTTLGGVVGRIHSSIGEYSNNTEENVFVASEAQTTEDFAALLKKGGNIILADGEYTFPAGNVYAGEVKVVAAEGANVVVNLLKSTYISGAKLTLEGLTFKTPAGLTYNESAFGFIHHAAEFNMNNCVVEGGRLRLNVVEANIDNCQFNVTASSGFDGYGLYYYGKNGSTVNISNSTFTALQKAVVLYNESKVEMNLNVDNCTFTASQTTDKAAISIHSELGIYGTVNITNSTATGFANHHGGLWRDVNNNTGKDNKNFTVTVDGEVVALKGYASTASTAEVVELLKSGENVCLTSDVTSSSILTVSAGAVLDGNGKTVTANGVDAYESFIAVREGTVQNIVVEGAFRALGTGGSGSYPMTGDAYYKNVTVVGSTYGFNISYGGGHKIYVEDCTIGDWNSYSGLSGAEFTNCTFIAQGNYKASQVVYGDVTFTYKNCVFPVNDPYDSTKYYLNGKEGKPKFVFENCKMSDGTLITRANITTYFKGSGFSYAINND